MVKFFLLIKSALVIASSLRITAIYLNRIALHKQLVAGVLVLLVLSGSGLGAYGSLFQVTTYLTELSKGLHVFSNLTINCVTTIAEYVYNSILSNFSVSCDGADDLPALMQFKDLHLTETLKSAKETLKGQPGVYCMLCQETSAMYIGSSCDMGTRLTDHIFNNSSNLHLQRAIGIYGLPAFIFIVVEFCRSSEIMAKEQHWLDWLYALSPSRR